MALTDAASKCRSAPIMRQVAVGRRPNVVCVRCAQLPRQQSQIAALSAAAPEMFTGADRLVIDCCARVE